MIAFGIYGLSLLIEEKTRQIMLGVITIILFINTLWAIQTNNTSIINQQQNLADAITWIKTLKNNDKILLALDFDGLIPKNKPCLLREYEANASDNYRMSKLNNLLKMPSSDSVSKFTLPILAQSFAFEDEKLFDTQYQIALKYLGTDSSKRFDTDYFFNNSNNMSHCFEESEALNRFNEGKYQYVVSKIQMPNLKPIKSFLKGGGDNFWAYEFKNPEN